MPNSELWHRLLHVIGESINVAIPHPLDRERVVRHLRNLYRVGERPSADEVREYVGRLWPAAPGARDLVTKTWRTILANPNHRFRGVRGWASLALLDRLAEQLTSEYGSPPLDWRVKDVLENAQARFAEVALSDEDLETYLAARRDLLDAVRTIKMVRELRLGYRATGNWIDMDPGDYTMADAVEWRRIQRRYAID